MQATHLQAYDDALALWRGEPLSDFAAERWPIAEAPVARPDLESLAGLLMLALYRSGRHRPGEHAGAPVPGRGSRCTSCRRSAREVTARLRDVSGVETVAANHRDSLVRLGPDGGG